VKAENVKDFLRDIVHPDAAVREPATRALPKLLETSHPQLIPFILSDLFDIYAKNNKVCCLFSIGDRIVIFFA
jgi:hypothetical protein